MRNVVPANALARRSRNLLYIGILVVLLGVFGTTVGFFMRAVRLVVPANPNFALYTVIRDLLVWAGILTGILGLVMIVRALTWRRDNRLAIRIGEALDEFLDDRYVFIRNLNRLALGYIDAVLIGPPGVLVFRITQRSGTFFNEGARWMKRKDKDNWHSLRWSPTKEVVVDINKVREFLQARGQSEVAVFGVIVFTEEAPATIVTTEDPVVPVLQPHHLSFGLSNGYFAKDRIGQSQVNKVAELLFG